MAVHLTRKVSNLLECLCVHGRSYHVLSREIFSSVEGSGREDIQTASLRIDKLRQIN